MQQAVVSGFGAARSSIAIASFTAVMSIMVFGTVMFVLPYYQNPSTSTVQGTVDQLDNQQAVQQYQINTLINQVFEIEQKLAPTPPAPTPTPSPTTAPDVWNGTAIALETNDGVVSRITAIQPGQLLIRQGNTITGVQPDYVFIVQALGYIPENVANRGQPDGYASLDSNGLVPYSQLPPIHTITVYNISLMSQLTTLTNASVGDYALLYLNNGTLFAGIYVLAYEPPTITSNWISLGGGSSGANNSIITLQGPGSVVPLTGPNAILTNQDLGNPWQFGGNSYGPGGTLGSNDANSFSLIANATVYFTLNVTTQRVVALVNIQAPNVEVGARFTWSSYPNNWIASGDGTFTDASTQDLVINSENSAVRLGNSGASSNATVVVVGNTVGIGLSVPTARLDVVGNIRFRDYSTIANSTYGLVGVDADGYLHTIQYGSGLGYNATTNTLYVTFPDPSVPVTLTSGKGISVAETSPGNWTIGNTGLLNTTTPSIVGNIVQLSYNTSDQTVSIQAYAIVSIGTIGDGLSTTTYPNGSAAITTTSVSEILSLSPSKFTFTKSPTNNTWFANYTGTDYNQTVVPTISAGAGIQVSYTNNGTAVVIANTGVITVAGGSGNVNVTQYSNGTSVIAVAEPSVVQGLGIAVAKTGSESSGWIYNVSNSGVVAIESLSPYLLQAVPNGTTWDLTLTFVPFVSLIGQGAISINTTIVNGTASAIISSNAGQTILPDPLVAGNLVVARDSNTTTYLSVVAVSNITTSGGFLNATKTDLNTVNIYAPLPVTSIVTRGPGLTSNSSNGDVLITSSSLTGIVSNTSQLVVAINATSGVATLDLNLNTTNTGVTTLLVQPGLTANATTGAITLGTTAVLNITSLSPALGVGGTNTNLTLSFDGVVNVTSNSSMLAATTYPDGSVVLTLLANETSNVYLTGGRGIIVSNPTGDVTINTTAVLNITSNSPVLGVSGDNDDVILTFNGTTSVTSNSSMLVSTTYPDGSVVLTLLINETSDVYLTAGRGIVLNSPIGEVTINTTAVLEVTSNSSAIVVSGNNDDVILSFNGVETILSNSSMLIVDTLSNNTVILSLALNETSDVYLVAGPGIDITSPSGYTTISNTGVLSLSSNSSALLIDQSSGNITLNFAGVADVVSDSAEILVDRASNGTVVLTFVPDAPSGIQGIVAGLGINVTTVNQTSTISNTGVVALASTGGFVQVANEGNGTWTIATPYPVIDLSVTGTPALTANASNGFIQLTSTALDDIVSNSSVLDVSISNGTAYIDFIGLHGSGVANTLAYWETNATLGYLNIGQGLVISNQTLLNTGVTSIRTSGYGLSSNATTGDILLVGDAIVNATSNSSAIGVDVIGGTLFISYTETLGNGTTDTLAYWKTGVTLASASVGSGLSFASGVLQNTGILDILVQGPGITVATTNGTATFTSTCLTQLVSNSSQITVSSPTNGSVTISYNGVSGSGTPDTIATWDTNGQLASATIDQGLSFANQTLKNTGVLSLSIQGSGLSSNATTGQILLVGNAIVNATSLTPILTASVSGGTLYLNASSSTIQGNGTAGTLASWQTSDTLGATFIGSGLSVSSQTLINSGVTSIGSNSAYISVSASTGNITLTYNGLSGTGTSNTLTYWVNSTTLASASVGPGLSFGGGSLLFTGLLNISSSSAAIPITYGSGTATINFAGTSGSGTNGSLALWSSNSTLSSATIGTGLQLTSGTLSNTGVLSIVSNTSNIVVSPGTGTVYLNYAGPTGSGSTNTITTWSSSNTLGYATVGQGLSFNGTLLTSTSILNITSSSTAVPITYSGSTATIGFNGVVSVVSNSSTLQITPGAGTVYIRDLGPVGSGTSNTIAAWNATGALTSATIGQSLSYAGGTLSYTGIYNTTSSSSAITVSYTSGIATLGFGGVTSIVANSPLSASSGTGTVSLSYSGIFNISSSSTTIPVTYNSGTATIGFGGVSSIIANSPLTASSGTGTVSLSYSGPTGGGTVNSLAYWNSTTNLAAATLVAGTNVAITSTGGSFTISATGGGGGSVNGVYAGAGMTVSPNTGSVVVTNNGVIAITVGAGLSISGTNYPSLTNTGVLSVAATGGITGSIVGQTLSIALSTGGSGNAILQGGNAFGATMQIGTTDNNAIQFFTNYNTRLQISTAGVLSAGAYSGTNNGIAIFDSTGRITRQNYADGSTTTTAGGAWSFSHNIGTTPWCWAQALSPGNSITQQYIATVRTVNSGSVSGFVIAPIAVLVGGNTMGFVGSGVTVYVRCEV